MAKTTKTVKKVDKVDKKDEKRTDLTMTTNFISNPEDKPETEETKNTTPTIEETGGESNDTIQVQETKKEEKIATVLPTKLAPKVEPEVKIRPNQDIKTYIGDRYWVIKKGEVKTVPKNVKEILMKAGMLDPI